MKPRLIRRALSLMGLVLASLLALSACASTPAPSDSPTATDSATTSVAKKVLLVISFGTSYDDNRELSVGGVEGALKTAYPDYEIRRAFTSQIIIDVLAERGTEVDNVTEAMDRIVADGIKDIVIQPTTIMAGYEYMDMVTETSVYQAKFDTFAIGTPLLTSDADFQATATALAKRMTEYAADDTAVVFMGHGTSAPSNDAYSKLSELLKKENKNILLGVIEGTPTLDDVLKEAEDAKVKKVVLAPLMIVAGDHANNDMAGDEPESWKSVFTKAGFEVQTLIEGLGQNADIQKMLVDHAQEAINRAATVPPATDAPSAAAPAEEVAAGQIKAGSYPINVTTSSSMFKVVEAELEAGKEGEHSVMHATITLSGDGYGRLLLGTAEQAAQASSGFIEFTTDDQGRHIYVVPVSRLNKSMTIAAESGKTPGKWYDQTVTFLSDKIPADVISAEAE